MDSRLKSPAILGIISLCTVRAAAIGASGRRQQNQE